MTLQTIADRVGVSRMTVSNAFSRPDQLSRELRAKILAAADELGYAGPDPAARALARGSTGAVGVLLTDRLREAFTDEVATAFLGAIVDELAPTGLAMTLISAAPHGDAIPARDVAIDGAVVYSCFRESSARDWLVKRKLPLVYVDQDPSPGIPCVNVDDRGGARAAAEHLLALGHRQIALLTSPVTDAVGEGLDSADPALSYPQRERQLGWLATLGAAGLEPVRTIRAPHALGEADSAEVGRLLFDVEPRPTAVLCFSDVLALAVMRAATERGLDVPADVSVVGFDDSPLSRHSQPLLTTVRQDVAAKGRLAAEALIAAIGAGTANGASEPEHVLLPTELVVRDSTARPPRRARRAAGRPAAPVSTIAPRRRAAGDASD